MREWFVNIAGENYASALMWTVVALILLLVLLVLIRIVRSFTFGTFVAGGRSRRPRLAVTDATAVDSHRRLVLVRRDNVEHLILIGGPSDLVVEQNIRESSEEPVFEAEETSKKEPAPVTQPAAAVREAPREEIRSMPPAAPTPAPTAPVPSSSLTAQGATVVPLKSEASPVVQPRQESPRPQAVTAAAAAAATAMPRSEAPEDRGEVEIDESIFELAEVETAAPPRESVSLEQQRPRETETPPAPAVNVPSATAQAESRRSDETAYSEPMLDDIDIELEESRESHPPKKPDESLEDEMSRLLEELSDNRR